MNLQTVGVVGIGNIGGRMARVLLDSFDVAVYDINRSRVGRLSDRGAIATSSAADLGERADVVLLSLPDDSAVTSVTSEADCVLDGLSPGNVLIDTSTISPDTSLRVAGICESASVDFLDAPVSGGARNAETGDLTVLVGGDAEVLDRVRGVFDTIAQTVYHVGPNGDGITLKVVNNYLFGLNQLVLAQGLMMARAAGIDDRTFAETVADASGGSYALERNMERFVLPNSFDSEFTLDLMGKDVALAEQFAAANDVPLFLDAASALYTITSELGYGDLDSAAIIKLYERLRHES